MRTREQLIAAQLLLFAAQSHAADQRPRITGTEDKEREKMRQAQIHRDRLMKNDSQHSHQAHNNTSISHPSGKRK